MLLEDGKVEDREKFRSVIEDIVVNCTEKRIGEWRGQTENATFGLKAVML